MEAKRSNVTANTRPYRPYSCACFEEVMGEGIAHGMGCKIGWKARSRTDLCTCSYDPELYYNAGAPPFPVKITERDQPLNYSILNQALAKRHID